MKKLDKNDLPQPLYAIGDIVTMYDADTNQGGIGYVVIDKVEYIEFNNKKQGKEEWYYTTVNGFGGLESSIIKDFVK